MKTSLLSLLVLFSANLLYSQAGSITGIQVSQRTDGSGMVDVLFNLSGQGSSYDMYLEASFDGGATYISVPGEFLDGTVSGVGQGHGKHIIWDGLGSFPNVYTVEAKVKIIATESAGVPCPGMPLFTDTRDGNMYPTIKIGNQCWMKDNLKWLPAVYPSSSASQTDSRYYVYDYQGNVVNDAKKHSSYKQYGVLYNWPASTEACPPGWHLPSQEAWTTMVNYLVNNFDDITETNTGNKLKSCRQISSPMGGYCNTSEHPRWNTHSVHYGTDEFGFSAFPGGQRSFFGSFQNLGNIGRWWSSSENSANMAPSFGMSNSLGSVSTGNSNKALGFSIRCVYNEDFKTSVRNAIGYSHLFIFDTRTQSLSGTVTNIDDDTAIADAVIILTSTNNDYSAESGVNGYFEIENVASGSYNMNVTKSGYVTYSQNFWVTGEPGQIIDVSLVPEEINSVPINDYLTAYAENMTQAPTNIYTLSGNVNINNVLFFSGILVVDKSSHLVHAEIYGAGSIHVPNVDNEDKYISPGGIPFKFYAANDTLYAKGEDYFFEIPVLVGGFPLTLAAIRIPSGSQEARLLAIPKIPYPVDYVFKQYMGDDIPTVVNNISATLIYSMETGEGFGVQISNLKANLGLVAIEDLSLSYESTKSIFKGSLKVKFPGVAPDPKKYYPAGDTLLVNIKNEDDELLYQTSFNEFVETMRVLGGDFIIIEMKIEFLSGTLNSLSVTLSGIKIPIFNTGLLLTKIHGGVYNLATEKWHLEATIDIETGLSNIPGTNRAPLKLSDFGVMIQPMNVFRGMGTFQVFESNVAGGFIEYNRLNKSISMEGKLSLGGILDGGLYAGLQHRQFTGSGYMTVKTPHIPCSLWDPWFCWIAWAGDREIGSARIDVNNYYIRSMVQIDAGKLGTLSLAQKIEFGRPTAPWFHYHIGTNYNNMVKLWKGVNKDGAQEILFQVPENTQAIMISANDTITQEMFDFTLISPTGVIYDESYHKYDCFEDANTCVMLIDQPQMGDWIFLTEHSGEINLYTMGIDQRPSGMINQPETRKTRSNDIAITLNDYADTLSVQVFYNTHNREFNGVLIDEFSVINNANLQFTWHNQDIPNGEYYIYTRIDDGKNAPILQFAPGSIWVENDTNIEIPKDFSVEQHENGAYTEWDKAVFPNTIAATVYYKDLSTRMIYQKAVIENNYAIIDSLMPGRGYEMWCKFINDAGTYSQRSNVVNFVITNAKGNNPPYFNMDKDSAFVFVVEENKDFYLQAEDTDGDDLTFSIVDNALMIDIQGNQLSWTPTYDDKGVHHISLVVSDGLDTDTISQRLIVYTQEQVMVSLAFNSVNLYELDNKFIIIRNFKNSEDIQYVTLTNLRTQQETEIACRRVNEFEYKGQIFLSYKNRSEIPVQDGDTIQAKYVYDDYEYSAYAYYSSNPQPVDNIPPGEITDLSVERLLANQVLLRWTATGNDGDEGRAYLYDIRYDYQPIETEAVYFTAHMINSFPYPSMAGQQDSLIVDLSGLQGVTENQIMYFSIKAEDEMQNRGGLSNSPAIDCIPSASNINVHLRDVYYIDLVWEGPILSNKDNSEFSHYDIYRSFNNNEMQLLQAGVEQLSFTDDLKMFPDGNYKYGIVAVYTDWESDLAVSQAIHIKRFVNVNILCVLDGTQNHEGILFQMEGLDNIYGQMFSRTTNSTGLVLLSNVYKSDYAVTISKDGYGTYQKIITVANNQTTFSFTLYCEPEPPEDIKAEEVTASIIVLEWTPVSLESEWEILFGEEGFDLESDGFLVTPIFEKPYTLSDLNAETSYDVYVRAVCGENTSEWAGPLTITTEEMIIPNELDLSGESILPGENLCYEALQAITVSDFLVEAGAYVQFIAGHSVHLLPGTVIEQGAGLVARIAHHENDFCGIPKATETDHEAITVTDFPYGIRKNGFFKLYPNPTYGTFTLEITNIEAENDITVEILSIMGSKIFSKQLSPQRIHTLDLADQKPGMYIIRVTKGEKTGVERLIKR